MNVSVAALSRAAGVVNVLSRGALVLQVLEVRSAIKEEVGVRSKKRSKVKELIGSSEPRAVAKVVWEG